MCENSHRQTQRGLITVLENVLPIMKYQLIIKGFQMACNKMLGCNQVFHMLYNALKYRSVHIQCDYLKGTWP